jgi:glutathione S-transferase
MLLHNMPISGNCYKVRLTARHLAIPLRLENYAVNGSKTRNPEFLAKNPNGRVPLLELDDGHCLAESGAILCYLAEGTRLVPADKWSRAEMLQWMFFEQYSHEPYVAVARFWLSYAPKDELEKKRHLVPEWHAKGNAALGVMETHLASRRWFAGDGFSLADIALYAYTHSADEGGFDLARYPMVSSWLKRVAAEPNHIPLSESW